MGLITPRVNLVKGSLSSGSYPHPTIYIYIYIYIFFFTAVAALGIFLRVFLRNHKLHNIIKREIYILKSFMIVSLSMLSATSLSIYTIKQSFIHWSPIRLRSSFFIYFIVEKLLSIVAKAIGMVKTNFTSK